IRWALVMMRLCAAWRNTSVRRTTGTAADEMTSASTWPAPTEGNWSMSPTIKRAAWSGTALMSDRISMTSTMDASSTTSRSQSSGLSSPRLNPPLLGSTSKSRWMVFASKPVASVMRLAARPVGAHKESVTPLRREYAKDASDDGGLADAGAAGDDQHLGNQRQPDSGYLAFRQGKPDALLDPRQCLFRVDPGPRQDTVRQP